MIGSFSSSILLLSILLVTINTQNVKVDEIDLEDPGQPQISFYNSRVAVLTWKKSLYTKDNYLMYKIEQRVNDGEWTPLVTVIPKDNSQPTTMVFLKPFTKYSFRVKAVNFYGDTGFSEPSIPVISQGETPEKEPESVIATVINATSITVEWDPVDKSYIHGNLTGYKIKYYPESKPSEAAETHVKDFENLSYTIKNLAPNTTYVISIKAVNHVGEGPAAAISVTTKENEVTPSEPLHLTVAAITDSTVQFLWTHPKIPQGDLDHYELNVETKALRNKHNVYDNNMIVEYTLKDLTPSTVYTAWVAVNFGSQRGFPSSKISVRTKAKGPLLMKIPKAVKEKCNSLCHQCFTCAVLEPLTKNREDVDERIKRTKNTNLKETEQTGKIMKLSQF